MTRPESGAAGLTLEDVKVGDTLPELRYEVTASTVVLGALGMRDWRPMWRSRPSRAGSCRITAFAKACPRSTVPLTW